MNGAVVSNWLINASVLGDKPTGLGVYAHNLISRLLQQRRAEIIGPRHYEALGGVIRHESPPGIALGMGRGAAFKRFFWLASLPRISDSLVYSPTHHGIASATRQLITIHDLICFRHPRQHLLQYVYFKYFVPRIFRHCVGIITVSEVSKQHIVQAYGLLPEDVHVVPPGVDCARFRGIARRPDAAARPFLLVVGARFPHKNVEELLRMHAYWSAKFDVVVTSCEGAYRQTLETLIGQLGLSDRVKLNGYVDATYLDELYATCAAMVYPSQWEGFGIPPLEALACGAPVIASDIPAHREVVADAAIYVRLGEAASWQSAFDRLQDCQTIAELKTRGEARVERFTWDKSVDALCHVLDLVGDRQTSVKVQHSGAVQC